ncbi:angiopoietin-related protein 7-like [Leptidea sinapis]|uniref:angiopoietin-related protein 7-like n=1 Tax=Leptidea sinapis TaxID=189913 RepID=UPI0021C2E14C|nr:angiopoietin-related protein 7-like [Leptidea sinapis]
MAANNSHLILLLLIIGSACEIFAKRKNDYSDKTLWKDTYESELTDAMISPKRGHKNLTRVAQSPPQTENEAVLDKLLETITSSEKYVKKIESIDFRLNRLDIEVHEKSNSILKNLGEVLKVVQKKESFEKFEPFLDNIRKELNEIKYLLENNPRTKTNNVEGAEYQMDSNLDSRLSFLENHMKNIMTSVDSIATIISEVKARQFSRTISTKNEGGAGTSDHISLISEFRRALHEQKYRKCDCKQGRVDRVERYPTDCQEIQLQGFNVSGIYKIRPDDIEPFYVLCDLNTAGGGWTVIQNRFDGSQDFFKAWSDYKHGFGNLAGEFWLGLEKLNFLTNQKLYELRVEMESQSGQEAYATYSVFTVGSEYEGYRISTLGTYRGNAGDSLTYHAGQKFSTLDADNDEWKDGACSLEHGGAWWYKECDKSNLNGKYMPSADEQQGQSIYWISFKGPGSPLAKTRMMIRPLPASRPADHTDSGRKILETNKVKPSEKAKGPRKESQGSYDMNRARAPYRFDNIHPEGFFPNYT